MKEVKKGNNESIKVFELIFNSPNNNKPFNNQPITSSKLLKHHNLSHSNEKSSELISKLNAKPTKLPFPKERYFAGWALTSKGIPKVSVKCPTIKSDIDIDYKFFDKALTLDKVSNNPVLIKSWTIGYISRTKFDPLEGYELKNSLPKGNLINNKNIVTHKKEGIKKSLKTTRTKAARWYGSLHKTKSKAIQPPLNLNIRRLSAKK